MLRERQQLADSLARILAQLGLERKTRIMDLTHVLREARDAHDADDGGHDRQEATSEPETAQEPVRTAAPNSKNRRRRRDARSDDPAAGPGDCGELPRVLHGLQPQSGLECKMDSAADRFMTSVEGFQDEAYRESIQITTRETLRRKAARGEVAGGKLYGYKNVRVASHVTRVIEEPEAALLRRIFEMVASGKGFVKIAKAGRSPGPPRTSGRPLPSPAAESGRARDDAAG